MFGKLWRNSERFGKGEWYWYLTDSTKRPGYYVIHGTVPPENVHTVFKYPQTQGITYLLLSEPKSQFCSVWKSKASKLNNIIAFPLMLQSGSVWISTKSHIFTMSLSIYKCYYWAHVSKCQYKIRCWQYVFEYYLHLNPNPFILSRGKLRLLHNTFRCNYT